MASLSPDYSINYGMGDDSQKAALQELLRKFGTQGATQPTQPTPPTTPTEPPESATAYKPGNRPSDPRVRQLILWFKTQPEYAVMEEQELVGIAQDIIDKGGHAPVEVPPEGGQ